jgi:hypothetical protein
MKPDVTSLVKLAQGYEKGRERLAELRVHEIRGSNFAQDKAMFDGLFESALKVAVPRKTYPMSSSLRAYFGVDR